MRARKLSRKKSNRKHLTSNLLASLIIHERITTTLAKAKHIQPEFERLIARSKKSDNLNSYRYVYSVLNQQKPSKKVVEIIKPNYKDINSGFTRIVKIGNRKGDNSAMAIIELTKKTEDYINSKKPKEDKGKKAIKEMGEKVSNSKKNTKKDNTVNN